MYEETFHPWFEKMRWGTYRHYYDDEEDFEQEYFKDNVIERIIEASFAVTNKGQAANLLLFQNEVLCAVSRSRVVLEANFVM